MTAPPRTLSSGNIPVALTSFVGRRNELAQARQLLSGSRLLTLTGAGGVGKTRLALQLAASVRRAFADGVWLVELAELTDQALLSQTVATAMGLRDDSAASATSLAETLSDKQLLLVLDNCEHMPDACAVLAGKLLPLAPDIKILATSRHRLGAEGEQLMHVKPFPVPESAVDDEDSSEAVRLFVDRAIAAQPGFRLDEEVRRTIVEICRRLDGVPLAIELAAVWVRALSPAQILSKLDDRFGLLTTGSRARQPRQRTLQAAIDWSFNLCSADERSLWERLAVFSGGFDLDAAEYVCSSADLPRGQILELVAGLVDKSIVIRNEQPHGTRARYRMPETVQAYGRARLAASGHELAFQARHRDYYRRLSLRYEAECFGPHQVQWLLLLRHEHANLRTAIEFCLTGGYETDLRNAQAALEIAGPTYHWISSGRLREGLTWLDRALALDTSPTAARAKALWVRSFLAILLGERDAPDRMLAECHRLAEQLDKTNVFFPKIWQCSGLAAFIRGELPDSQRLFEQALAGHLKAGHLHCAFDCMFQLALIALHQDDPNAGKLSRRCLDFCEEHHADWSKSYALWLLGVHSWRQGDPDGAIPLLQESIRLRRPVNDLTGLAFCVEALASSESSRGQWIRAATLLGASYAVWERSGVNTSDAGLHRFAHREVEETVRSTLGEDAFATAYARGAACNLDEAMALALPAARTRPGGDTFTEREGPRILGPLTRRESEIAEFVAQGLGNREIATTLVISQRTAESHVEHILTKLGFTSRAQIASWVTEHHKRS